MRNFVLPLLVVVTVSCLSNNESNTNSTIHLNHLDTVQSHQQISATKSKLDSTAIELYEQEALKQVEKEIETVYGKQWDFCDCVAKTDSIQKAIEAAGDLTDDEFDALMSRFETIDQHCKSLIAGPNATPEERKKHERKVKKCLKNRS